MGPRASSHEPKKSKSDELEKLCPIFQKDLTISCLMRPKVQKVEKLNRPKIFFFCFNIKNK